MFAPWGAALLALGFVRRHRRRRADVTGQRARGARRAFEAALRRGDDALDAFAGYLGDRLAVPPAAVLSPELRQRLLAAGLDEAAAADVEQLVERGTAARYGGGGRLTVDEVRTMVQRLEGAKFGAGGWLPLLLLPLLWSAAPLPAQQESAVAAYRNGDYAAAEAGFAAAYEATGDRRLLRARGNCFYRLGDLARARWAYECARIGLPRDAELAANLRVVRRRLELPEPALGFGAEMQALLERMTAMERLLACSAASAIAAACLLFGWRRLPVRWLGFAALVPGAWLAIAILWWLPSRPPKAVALQPLALRAEPRDDLAVIARVRAGALVEIRGGAAAEHVRVAAGDHVGYVPAEAVGIVR
ncbi:MAG TPA: hypothetical protein ENI87_13445 [bacterium]|nr:hypothetical protein [bacterium]